MSQAIQSLSFYLSRVAGTDHSLFTDIVRPLKRFFAPSMQLSAAAGKASPTASSVVTASDAQDGADLWKLYRLASGRDSISARLAVELGKHAGH